MAMPGTVQVVKIISTPSGKKGIIIPTRILSKKVWNVAAPLKKYKQTDSPQSVLLKLNHADRQRSQCSNKLSCCRDKVHLAANERRLPLLILIHVSNLCLLIWLMNSKGISSFFYLFGLLVYFLRRCSVQPGIIIYMTIILQCIVTWFFFRAFLNIHYVHKRKYLLFLLFKTHTHSLWVKRRRVCTKMEFICLLNRQLDKVSFAMSWLDRCPQQYLIHIY